jgi:biopolymer transport protein ExbB/TolQ
MSKPTADRLVWSRRDIEQRLGFRGNRFTRVNGILSFLIASAMTIACYGAIMAIGSNPFTDMFTERGFTPYVIVFFSLWSLVILLIKLSKLGLQRQALALELLPDETGFTLSVATVDRVVDRLFELSDDPKSFVLLNRVHIALSNLRNLGRVTDVGEILRSQAEHDESTMETSYNAIRGLVWAIPILGFIGTVSGLSGAIGGFGRVLSETDDPAQLIDALKGVTGGLATAFETTLVALVAALAVQMLMTFVKKREEEFLDECAEHCQRVIVNRLRINQLESAR